VGSQRPKDERGEHDKHTRRRETRTSESKIRSKIRPTRSDQPKSGGSSVVFVILKDAATTLARTSRWLSSSRPFGFGGSASGGKRGRVAGRIRAGTLGGGGGSSSSGGGRACAGSGCRLRTHERVNTGMGRTTKSLPVLEAGLALRSLLLKGTEAAVA